MLIALGRPAEAQVQPRFEAITAGAITFTGNTLGLDTQSNSDAPGTQGSIGTFITTDTGLRDNSNWPSGTTEDFRQNRSEADLRLPAGARVLHAELVWGGSWADDSGDENVGANLQDPVQFTTPAGTQSVAPDPTFLVADPDVRTSGDCPGNEGCFYVRSADVTALVQASGAGRYAVGGVPGTQSTGGGSLKVAGWTLAVAYEDFNQPFRNLTLFRGLARQGAPPAQVSGFCTPPSGPPAGRLAVSVIEGDADLTGDEMRFGPTASLTSANRLSGPRNPATNFFASQITDDEGNLDTTGTFGERNHDPGDPSSGARQGWDIVNVDVSSQLTNEETSAFVQGTTNGDKFIITTLGVQIDVGAPRFATEVKTVTPAVAQVGGTLTYTIDLVNQGTADANDVVFFDTPPPGTTFAGNFMLDGAPVAGADPVTGVPIGTIAVGATRTVQFDVTVDTVPAAPADAIYANSASWTFTFVSCAGQAPQPGTTVTNAVTSPIARIGAAKAVIPASLAAGEHALFVVTLRNTGTAPATGVTLTDPLPAGVTYVPGTTRLNTLTVPDVAGAMPFAAGAPVNSPGDPAGQIDPGRFAVVSFLVAADPSAQGTITNIATIDPDGPGGEIPPFEITDPLEVISEADLQIAKSGTPSKITVPPGGMVTYELTVTNNGPSNVASATVTDSFPPGLTCVPAAPCATGFPCALGPLDVGASQTIMITCSVPGTYAGPDPISNTATVAGPPTVPDPNPDNNTSSSQTAIAIPASDLGVTKTDGRIIAVPGTRVTYTIVVTNAGPDPAIDAQVADTFPPGLTNPTWTCTATAGSSCPGSGSGPINETVTILNGGILTFTVIGDIPPDAGVGTLFNTVTVTPPAGSADPNGGNNVATDRDALRPEADLSLTKTGPATAVPGESVTYELTVTNNGPSDAVNVRLFDPDHSSMECPDLVGCNLGTIPAGESRTITVVVDVPLDVPVPGEITNVALVDSGTFDPDGSNNVDGNTATLTPMADLEITKSGFETVVAGTTVGYRITVTNRGPSIATNVQVSDPSPPGLTFVSNAEACTTPFPCTLGMIPPGESRTIVSTYEVPPDYAGPDPVVNTASVTSPTPDPDPGDNTVTTPSAVVREADIAVEKTADPRTVSAGGTVTYSITATNRGPSDATGVVVSDVLPAEVTLTSATPSQGSYDASTGTWTVGDLALGASATLTITATVNVQGQLRNTATKTGGNEFDPDTSNDSAGTVLNAIVADVGIDIVAGSEIAQVGEGVNFTITVVNRGPDPATSVVAHLGTITGATFVSAEFPAGTSFNSTDFTWVIGNLAVGQSVVLTGVFDVTQESPLIEVFRTHTELDPNPANDRDFVLLNPLGDAADIQVSKSASNEMPQVGERVSFTVTVRNNGPSPATTVVVQDPVPPGLTFVSATPSQGTFDPATGRWEVGPLGVNVSETLALMMDVAQPGTWVNTATSGGGDQPDPNPNNNTGTATLVVPPAPAADLSMVKTAAPATVAVGEQITWTLTVANAGPETAPGVMVTDIVPLQVSLVSATPSQGTCSPMGGQLICNLGDLPAGATATVTIVATRTAPDAFLNTASVSGGVIDPNTGNNTSTVQTGPAGEQDCGNCIDDDGDGLVDAEDPDCCADPQTLMITKTRRMRARLQIKGRLAAGAFAGIDPRQADVQLVLRDAQGAVACCAVPPDQWRKVLGRVYWFRDRQNECPPLKSLCLIVPKRDPTRTVVNTSPQTPSPLDITLSTGNQCVRGQSSSRPRARGKAVSR